MIDQQNVELAAERFQLPEGSFERLTLRRDRKRRDQRIRAGVLGVAIAVAVVWLGVNSIRSTPAVPGGHIDTDIPPPQGVCSSVRGQDLSPDGSRLLEARNRNLVVIEPDGSETALVRFDRYTLRGASFSPDGATVVYAGNAGDGPFGIWTIASDGSEEPRLVLEGNALYEPAYSPDGQEIAYVSGSGDHSHSLRVMNADGTDVRVLFDATTPPFDGAGHVRGVKWSADGSLIAIATDYSPGIYTIRPDGTDLSAC